MSSKLFRLFCLSLLILSLYACPLFAGSQATYQAGEILVKVQVNVELKADQGRVTSNNTQLQAVLDEIDANTVTELFPFDRSGTRLSRSYQLGIIGQIDVVEAVKKLWKVECVQSAQPNYVYKAFATPTDSSYADQMSLKLIQSAAAWDIFTGNDKVVVAVLDTGVDYTHNDLAANIWTNTNEIPNNNIDDDHNGYVDDRYGWDFVSERWVYGSIDPNDPNKVFIDSSYWKPEDNNPGNDINDPIDPHGTHVAGIVGAVANNTVSGSENIVGVLWNCNLMAVRAGNSDGSFSTSAIAKGLRYAADNGAQVINMSFGGSGGGAGIELDALQYAYNKGVFLCAAAGNASSSIRNYPAAFDIVTAVAAVNTNDVKADFSSFGTYVDISAPGVDILSTVLNNQYEQNSGTSMAAPFVSGAAGLVIGYGNTVGKKFSPAQVKSILQDGADNIDALNTDYPGMLGAGRLNLNNSLLLAETAKPIVSTILIQLASDPAADPIYVKEHTAENFQALAAYTDGSTVDVTDRVTWSIRPTRYGSFSNLTAGLFSALQVPENREVVITACLPDNGLCFTGEKVITIQDDPNAAPVAINGPDQIDPLSSTNYQALFQDAEGQSTDVTANVTWELISGMEYANFDNSQAGVLLTKSGSAGQKITIRATYIDQTDRRIYQQSKDVQISNTISQIAGLFLTAPGEVAAGSSLSLTAQLIRAGQVEVEDVTANCVWSSSPAAAGSFVEPGRFVAGNVTSETEVTLSAQYTINGQVYTAQLTTTVIPAVAQGVTTQDPTKSTEDESGTPITNLLGSLPCSLPAAMVFAGLFLAGMALYRQE